MAYGSMGGDAQPQVQAGVYTATCCIASRSTRPSRGRAGMSQDLGKPIGNLVVEGGLMQPHRAAHGRRPRCGADRRHRSCRAIVLHPDGSMEGAHDPRADGGAAGV